MITVNKDILLFIHDELSHPWLDWFFYWISTTTTFSFPLVAGICVFLAVRFRREGVIAAIAFVVTIALADSVGHLLKAYFQHARPCLEYGDLLHSVFNTSIRCTSSHDGMPSNHALNFFAAFSFLASFYRNKTWGTLGIILAALVGVSRVYLGLHFPSQVLVGAGIGIFMGTSAAYILRWNRYKNRSFYAM